MSHGRAGCAGNLSYDDCVHRDRAAPADPGIGHETMIEPGISVKRTLCSNLHDSAGQYEGRPNVGVRREPRHEDVHTLEPSQAIGQVLEYVPDRGLLFVWANALREGHIQIRLGTIMVMLPMVLHPA